MSPPRMLARSLGTVALVGALAPPTQPEARAQRPAEACELTDVDYVLAATLQIRDTTMGKGDGVYAIGPGTATLRFDRRREGAEGGTAIAVRMIAYAMRERFTVQSTALFWTTTVVTDSTTRVGSEPCSGAAEGLLDMRSLRWTGPVRGYATDGTITCDGSLCGKLGAPPAGRSELHVSPHAVPFAPFAFGLDGKTFTMEATLVAKVESPRHSAYLALSGRELRRTCVAPGSCP